MNDLLPTDLTGKNLFKESSWTIRTQPSFPPSDKVGSTTLENLTYVDSLNKNLLSLIIEITDLRKKIDVLEVSFVTNISDLDNIKYSLNYPIGAIITKEGSIFLAEMVDFDIYGEGEDVKYALNDLKKALIDYYENLKNQKRLSKELYKKFLLLKKMINEK